MAVPGAGPELRQNVISRFLRRHHHGAVDVGGDQAWENRGIPDDEIADAFDAEVGRDHAADIGRATGMINSFAHALDVANPFIVALDIGAGVDFGLAQRLEGWGFHEPSCKAHGPQQDAHVVWIGKIIELDDGCRAVIGAGQAHAALASGASDIG
jgi:hypothetical protein